MASRMSGNEASGAAEAMALASSGKTWTKTRAERLAATRSS